ncbi:hypothetical protein EG68_10016 [Paragonimus skrjabini miyazakii]|uniref:Uncharacterized protein n=1 Tax=Paragonimus skrjabini miyazakii TaxID=59628 RepID=A0A8S9YLQ9_9TREM|nr:hypothetical protein EG68_10016 [Paragonimus skrjabini miyazakii]
MPIGAEQPVSTPQFLEDPSNQRPNRTKAQRKSLSSSTNAFIGKPSQCTTTAADFLGYDWIAAMLDNQLRVRRTKSSPVHRHPDSAESLENWLNQKKLFDEIAHFRQMNNELCCSQDATPTCQSQSASYVDHAFKPKESRPTGAQMLAQLEKIHPVRMMKNSTSVLSSLQPQIYSYLVNSRLFPIPSDLATFSRPTPLPGQPHILRVTVPLHHFRQPPVLLQELVAQKEPASAALLSEARDRCYLVRHDGKQAERVLGTISLIGHCVTPSSGESGFGRGSSRSSERFRLLRVSGVGSHETSLSESRITCLPRWVRQQPTNEQDAIAMLLRKPTVV